MIIKHNIQWVHLQLFVFLPPPPSLSPPFHPHVLDSRLIGRASGSPLWAWEEGERASIYKVRLKHLISRKKKKKNPKTFVQEANGGCVSFLLKMGQCSIVTRDMVMVCRIRYIIQAQPWRKEKRKKVESDVQHCLRSPKWAQRLSANERFSTVVISSLERWRQYCLYTLCL